MPVTVTAVKCYGETGDSCEVDAALESPEEVWEVLIATDIDGISKVVAIGCSISGVVGVVTVWLTS